MFQNSNDPITSAEDLRSFLDSHNKQNIIVKSIDGDTHSYPPEKIGDEIVNLLSDQSDS